MKALYHLCNFVWVRMMAVNPPLTEKGDGAVLSVQSGKGSGCMGGPRDTFHRSDETGSGRGS